MRCSPVTSEPASRRNWSPMPRCEYLGGTQGCEAQLSEHLYSHRLAGFGRVNAQHAELSTDHRAVLVSEETLRPDQVHFYTVRVPQAFFRRGAKSISVGLAFNPPTRVTRLKYLSSRMSLHVYRGLDVDEIRAKYAASVEDVPDLPDRHKVDLQPSDAVRLKGANQAERADWTQSWSQEYAEIVVVRNTYRWPYGDEPIPYGLALVLEVLEDNLPLYAELELRWAPEPGPRDKTSTTVSQTSGSGGLGRRWAARS